MLKILRCVVVMTGGLAAACGSGSTAPSNRPPFAGTITISPTGTGMAGVTNFQFTAQGAQDPDGGRLTYNWTFGDGTTGAGAAPTHTYANTGSFTVALTVSDSRESAAAATVTLAVGPNLSSNWSHTAIALNQCLPQPPCNAWTMSRLTIVQSGDNLSGALTPNVNFIPTGAIDFAFAGTTGLTHPARVRFTTGDIPVAAINNSTLNFSFDGETNAAGTAMEGTFTRLRKYPLSPLCGLFPAPPCPDESIVTVSTFTRQ